MKRNQSFNLGLVFFLLTVLLSSCEHGPKVGPPAVAPKPKAEGDLAYLLISPKAYASLQIKSEPPRTEFVQEQTEYTGWIMVPQGSEVTLTAPQAGFLRKPEIGTAGPLAGKTVKEGQELFQLEPVLAPLEELQMASLKRDVASEKVKAQISLSVALKELGVVTDLHKKGLRGQQEVDKVQERVDQAQETLNGAKDKEKLYFPPAQFAIKAPLAGTVLTVSANPGEFVAKSAPLITIADLSKLWVRVPIPEYDVASIKPNQTVQVAIKGSKVLTQKKIEGLECFFSAKTVALVPQVDLQKHTVDLIYELVPPPPTKGTAVKPLPLVKDQMVSVWLPVGEKIKKSVVPYSAVVFDNLGGTWIYLDRGKKKVDGHEAYVFERKRVQLGSTVDSGISLQIPFQPNDRIVINGAAALFSSEFHSAPGIPQEIDDDD